MHIQQPNRSRGEWKPSDVEDATSASDAINRSREEWKPRDVEEAAVDKRTHTTAMSRAKGNTANLKQTALSLTYLEGQKGQLHDQIRTKQESQREDEARNQGQRCHKSKRPRGMQSKEQEKGRVSKRAIHRKEIGTHTTTKQQQIRYERMRPRRSTLPR